MRKRNLTQVGIMQPRNLLQKKFKLSPPKNTLHIQIPDQDEALVSTDNAQGRRQCRRTGKSIRRVRTLRLRPGEKAADFFFKKPIPRGLKASCVEGIVGELAV